MRLVSLLLSVGLVMLIVWAIGPFGGEVRVAKHDGIFTKPLSTSQPKPAPRSPEESHAAPAETPRDADDPSPDIKSVLLAREKAGADPLAGLQDKSAAPAQKPKGTLYYRVTVRDGGTLEVDGSIVTLEGIVARDAKAMCSGKDKKRWACGAAARTALTRLIRARAVFCRTSSAGKAKQSFTARCSVGGTDLSAWMVRRGWAKPKEPTEPALANAAKAAQSERIGLWRSAE